MLHDKIKKIGTKMIVFIIPIIFIAMSSLTVISVWKLHRIIAVCIAPALRIRFESMIVIMIEMYL